MKTILKEEQTITDKKLGSFTVPAFVLFDDDIEVIKQDDLTTTFTVVISDGEGIKYNKRDIEINNDDLSICDDDYELLYHLDMDKMDIGMEYFSIVLLICLFPFNEDHNEKSFKCFLDENGDDTFDQDVFDEIYFACQQAEDDIIHKAVEYITDKYSLMIKKYK